MASLFLFIAMLGLKEQPAFHGLHAGFKWPNSDLNPFLHWLTRQILY